MGIHAVKGHSCCHDDNVCFGLDDEKQSKDGRSFYRDLWFYKQKRASLVLKERAIRNPAFFLSC